MLNSKDYDDFIEYHSMKVMYPIKTGILDKRQKEVIRKALFLYQKDSYIRNGDLPESQRDIISEIADKLHLR
tara:strand:- start:82 stop:297 length:216 start_codon:yes stop_codon:yes gene_type:complete